jgi:hypothetical protein
VKALEAKRVSLSIEERQKEMARALQLILERLGDRKINAFSLDPTEPPFSDIHQTTWIELQEMNYVRPLLKSSRFSLTGSGWLRALQHSGATRNRSFDRDSETLLASIKRQVKGGHGARIVMLKALARDSGLSESWIYNALESDLLEAHYGRKGATWAHGFEGSMIHVPRTFGLKL